MLSIIVAYIYAKSNSKNRVSRIGIIYLFGLIFYIARLFEEAMLFEGNAYYARIIQDALLLAMTIFSLSLIYYQKPNHGFMIMSGIISVGTFIVMLTNKYHHQYIRTYAYGKIEYGQFMRQYADIILLIIIIFVCRQINSFNKKELLNNKIILAYSLLVSVYGGYFLWINKIVPYTLELHVYLLFLALTIFLKIAFEYMSTYVLPNYFGLIVENILETIIVANDVGKVVYMNNANISRYITSIENITSENITNIFKENTQAKVIHRDGNQINVEIIDEEEKHLINCVVRRIESENQVNGYVYILSDFTYLQKMIEDLNDKNKKLLDINEELADYSEVVSQLEIELENERFIKDVKKYLGQSYLNLYHILHKSLFALEEKDAYTLKYIDDAIDLARDNLSKVRSVVLKYKKEK
jgi:hypothetical protein